MDMDQDFKLTDVEKIKSDGITIRVGNKVVKLEMTGEEILQEDDLIKEYEHKMLEYKKTVINDMMEYKEQMKSTLRIHKKVYDKSIKEFETRLKSANNVPILSDKHSSLGLSVISVNSHLVWYFKCVYQPKYINDKVIDPGFAKRLMTPIQIKIKTDGEGKVYDLKLIKIIGNDKFPHYHATGDTDCWGDFNYNELIKTPDEMITFCRKVQSLLEVINELSLGTENPKGLSRMATLRKHNNDDNKETKPKKGVNSRSTRSGFDQSINDDVSTGWST